MNENKKTEEKKEDLYHINDTVYNKNHGKGIVKNIDPDNNYFHYDVHFEDGTNMWIPEWQLSNKPEKKAVSASQLATVE